MTTKVIYLELTTEEERKDDHAQDLDQDLNRDDLEDFRRIEDRLSFFAI